MNFNNYDEYLKQHKANVVKGYDWLKSYMPELINDVKDRGVDLDHIIIYAHDASKTTPEEYKAYNDYFYGGNRSHAVVTAFNYAWLNHIHNNKHHWQYWILHNDEVSEGTIALDIPDEYIIEMICDWWSFSWKGANLFGIFKWYGEHSANMRLSYRTRRTVESILTRMLAILEGLVINERTGSDDGKAN